MLSKKLFSINHDVTVCYKIIKSIKISNINTPREHGSLIYIFLLVYFITIMLFYNIINSNEDGKNVFNFRGLISFSYE